MQAPDALLLFRKGDFYECFYDDAKTVSKTLGLPLTARESDGLAMAGFPARHLEAYLGKLLAGGHRAAICDETE